MLFTWITSDHSPIILSLLKKDTEKNNLLYVQSAHPTSLKCGLPFSQFTRQICSDRIDFKTKPMLLYSDFSSRGYLDIWLDTALNEICSSSNNSVPKEKNEIEIKHIANTHWHIIQSDEQLHKLFFPLCDFYGNAILTDVLVLCLQL